MSNRRTQLIDKNKNPVAYLGSVSGARYIDGLKWYVEDGGVGSGHSAESHSSACSISPAKCKREWQNFQAKLVPGTSANDAKPDSKLDVEFIRFIS